MTGLTLSYDVETELPVSCFFLLVRFFFFFFFFSLHAIMTSSTNPASRNHYVDYVIRYSFKTNGVSLA